MFGRINIGNRVYIGMVAIILPGVSVADGVMIGAGSVVTKSWVYAGNPARFICTKEQLKERKICT